MGSSISTSQLPDTGATRSTSQLPDKPLSARDMNQIIKERKQHRKKEQADAFLRHNPKYAEARKKVQQAEFERMIKCTQIMKNFDKDVKKNYDARQIWMPEEYESCTPEIQALGYIITWVPDRYYGEKYVLRLLFPND